MGNDSHPVRIVQRHSGMASSDGGGVRLTRLLGTPSFGYQDPFLLLDEFRSDRPSDYLAGFPEHPHRGFETVTYMLAGSMEHRDHLGNCGRLEPGGVQWMRAGRGVLHSEMPRQRDGLMWGFQLWVNLPAADKMSAPDYRDYSAAEIPQLVDENGVVRRVIAGRCDGVEGAISQLVVAPLYLDLQLPAGAELEQPLPTGACVLLYLYQGQLSVDGQCVDRGELLRLAHGNLLSVQAGSEPARALLLAAQPLGEPVVQYGPFVMNNDEEIQQAVLDYQRGQLL